MAKRKVPEINAASMADIAFMLLIFFLVATTMDIDTGLKRSLPPMPEDDQDTEIEFRERNIFVVLVNKNDELLVENDLIPINQLKDRTIEFLTNPNNDPDLPEKQVKEFEYLGSVPVSKGIISLRNDNGTSYNMYIQVLNELTAAGDYVRDQFCYAKLNMAFEDISDKEIREEVKDAVPVIISEAEPKNIGGN